MRVAIPEAVELMLEVVDRMVLVSEQELKRAMGLFLKHTGHLPEGAGAAPLAAALNLSDELKDKHVCLIATGGNVDEGLKREIEDNYLDL